MAQGRQAKVTVTIASPSGRRARRPYQDAQAQAPETAKEPKTDCIASAGP